MRWLVWLVLIGCTSEGVDATGDTDALPVGTCDVGPAPVSAPSTLVADPFVSTKLTRSPSAHDCIIVEDLDDDGHLDIAVADDGFLGGPAHIDLYWGDGTREFVHTEVSTDTSVSSSCTALDVDDDGRLDLLLGGQFSLRFLINEGGRSFTLADDLAELPANDNRLRRNWIVPVDMDRDGHLDLLVGTSGAVFQCRGLPGDDPNDPYVDIQVPVNIDVPAQVHCLVWRDGRYLPDTTGMCPASVAAIEAFDLHGVAAADFDRDGLTDIFVGSDFGENVLLRGTGSGFEDISAQAGVDGYNHAMGVSVADFDGDGIDDVYVSDVGPDQLFGGLGCGRFERRQNDVGIAEITHRTITWGTVAADLDLDGDVDLFVANTDVVGLGEFAREYVCDDERPYEANHDLVLVNDGTGRFDPVQVPHDPAADMSWKRNTAVGADLDADGDIDVVVIEPPHVRILWNEVERAGSWLEVRPVDGRGRAVLGTRVDLVQGERRRVQWLQGRYATSGHAPVVAHFGLGVEPGPMQVVATWPDGQVTTVEGVSPGEVLELTAP